VPPLVRIHLDKNFCKRIKLNKSLSCGQEIATRITGKKRKWLVLDKRDSLAPQQTLFNSHQTEDCVFRFPVKFAHFFGTFTVALQRPLLGGIRVKGHVGGYGWRFPRSTPSWPCLHLGLRRHSCQLRRVDTHPN